MDEHATNTQLLTTELAGLGLRPESVGTAEAALAALRLAAGQDPFAVVVMGLHLLDLDGPALARRIRNEVPAPSPAMILLAGPNDVKLFEEAEDGCFQAVLHKPLKHQAVVEAIARILPPETAPVFPEQAMAMAAAAPEASIRSDNRDLEDITRRLAVRPVRILVVDDVLMNQTVVQTMLKKLGVATDVAVNGLEAVRALEKSSYDMVLMDLQMPVMDGLEATRVIRSPDSAVANHAVIVVATTAHAMKGDEEQCLAAGMNDYLAKPIRTRQLAEMLAKWLL